MPAFHISSPYMSQLAQSHVSFIALRACPDCGLISTLPEPRAGFELQCRQCHKTFNHAHPHSVTWAMACAATGLLFYIVLLSAPLLQVTLYNRTRWSTVTTGLNWLNFEGFWQVALVIFATALLIPILKLSGLLTVLTGLRRQNPPRWIVPLFRHLKRLNAWAMAEIFLLGFLVAYTRLQSLVHVHIDIAAFAMIGFVLSMVSLDVMLDAEAVWKEMHAKGLTAMPDQDCGQAQVIGCYTCHQVNPIGSADCLRCGATIHYRKINSRRRTVALVLAAIFFYVPANIFPILQITKLSHTEGFTIWGGILDFLRTGMWPLALLVFVASMVIPLFKLVALAGMLLIQTGRSPRSLLWRTRLYRFIDFIGRWSMIDIFMLSILVGLVQFGALAQVTSGTGAACFAAVVILTMLAVLSFDPRLMWDRYNTDDHHESLRA